MEDPEIQNELPFSKNQIITFIKIAMIAITESDLLRYPFFHWTSTKHVET